ncbi:MAG: SprT-like domain-containing protein [Chitinophagaceae bacterium]
MEKLPFDALRQYLPDNSFEWVMPLIERHKVHLTITRERQTKLGDYRNAHAGRNHRISVNGNLNKYSFLITLLHELAHLLAYEQYGNRIQAHGREWKHIFSGVLKEFLQHHIFPGDITREIQGSLHNPAASSCAEEGLQRVLMNYDKKRPGVKRVEELEAGKQFRLSNGKIFQKGERIRKRYRCTELATGKMYLFSPVYEVIEI